MMVIVCMWAIEPVIYVVLKLLATASMSFNSGPDSKASSPDPMLPLLHTALATLVLYSG